MAAIKEGPPSTGVQFSKEAVLRAYSFPQSNTEVYRFAADDYRVPIVLNALRPNFHSDNPKTEYLLAFPDVPEIDNVDQKVVGVGTIEPSSEDSTNPALRRLARLNRRQYDTDADYQSMLEMFMYTTGCKDLARLWHLGIVDPLPQLSRANRGEHYSRLITHRIGHSGLFHSVRGVALAQTQEAVEASLAGDLTHATTLVNAADARLLREWGWPLQSMETHVVSSSRDELHPYWMSTRWLADIARARRSSVFFKELPVFEKEATLPQPAEVASEGYRSAYHLEYDDRHLRRQLKESVEQLEAKGEYKGGYVMFIMDGEDPLADVARACETRNFAGEIAEGSPEVDATEIAREMQENYGPHDQQGSTFLYLYDPNGRDPEGDSVGMVRITHSGPDGLGLKTLADLPKVWAPRRKWGNSLSRGSNIIRKAMKKHVIDPVNSWDIASLVVEPGYRKLRELNTLHHGLHELKDNNPHITTWTSIVVTKYFNTQTDKFGIPWAPILGLEERKHMGEPSIAAYLHTAAINESMKSKNERHFRMQCLGEGLSYNTIDRRRTTS